MYPGHHEGREKHERSRAGADTGQELGFVGRLADLDRCRHQRRGTNGGASTYRTHRPTGGAAVGAHITQVLRKNAADRKIDVRVNSKVVQIMEDDKGRVTGGGRRQAQR